MSNSKDYLELAIHVDGKEKRILRVPTLWDDIDKQWLAFVQLEKSKRIISAVGKDSFCLQNNFNLALKRSLENEQISQEIISLFKPISELEKQ